MLLRFRVGAPVIFWLIIMMSVIIGVNQGYSADSAANATIDLNTSNATENISVDDVEGEGLSAASERGVKRYTKSQIKTSFVTAEAVANSVGPFVYANQGWLRPWFVKPLLQVLTIGPVIWMGFSVLGRVRNAFR